LLEDTAVVGNGIRTTIAEKTPIPRRELFGELCRLIEASPLVFVTGAAGSGKSALVKSAFTTATQSGVGFAFRAVSLTGYHINEALHRLGRIPESLKAAR
jgi:ABC-type ATPase involved in cell division